MKEEFEMSINRETNVECIAQLVNVLELVEALKRVFPEAEKAFDCLKRSLEKIIERREKMLR